MWCVEIRKRESVERAIVFVPVVVERVWRHKTQLREQCREKGFFRVPKRDVFEHNGRVDDIRRVLGSHAKVLRSATL